MDSKKIITDWNERCRPCAFALTMRKERQVVRDLEVLEIFRRYIEMDYDEDGKLNVWGFSGIDLQALKPGELKKVEEWLDDK